MPMHYLDPRRASEPYSLPSIETFFVEPDAGLYDEDDDPVEPGWYWQSCLPGCLPDGGPIGPFDTEDAALADAREGVVDDE